MKITPPEFQYPQFIYASIICTLLLNQDDFIFIKLIKLLLVVTVCLIMTGSFASLRAVFTFKRRVSYFISATYMPAIILVILSWCCFWIQRTAVPARITLSITTILTTILLYGSVNSNMPKVSTDTTLTNLTAGVWARDRRALMVPRARRSRLMTEVIEIFK